jgi:DNA (cytosine-5)-methyltransferase 1
MVNYLFLLLQFKKSSNSAAFFKNLPNFKQLFMVEKKPIYIDLFTGCGGLSLGLHNAGWKGLFAVEKSPDAFKTLKHNLIDKKDHFEWPSWLGEPRHLEINHVIENYKDKLIELRGQIDMVAGGPPCQGFSTAGRRKEGDVRNGLIKSYLRFIMHVRPKVIFFENVKGFTLKFEKNKSKGITYSQYVLRALKLFGYEVEGRMVDFSRYGVPQKRTRFILVGIRKDVAEEGNLKAKYFFKQITKNKKGFLASKHLPQSPNLGSAISDLLKSNGSTPTTDRKGGFKNGLYANAKSNYQKYLRLDSDGVSPNSHSFPRHKPEIEKRFKVFLTKPKGKNLSPKTKEKLQISKHTIIPLSAIKKAPTITTLPDDYIHYSEPRILTVREYARIQSFPDWYQFLGKYTTGGKARRSEVPRYTQIGNAIPPLFGEQSGLVLKQLIA